MAIAKSEKSEGKKSLSILWIVLLIIILPVLVVNLTFIIKSLALPDEVPSFAGYKPFIVLSGSMEPVFHTGDLVLVRNTDTGDLKVNDIISYRQGDSVITHRIAQINVVNGRKRFVTKGDNNNVADAITVTEEMVEGKYLFSIPRLGNAAMFVQTPGGLLIFVALPLLLFIFYEIYSKKRSDKKEKQKKEALEAEVEKLRKQLSVKTDSVEEKENLKFEAGY